MSLHIFQDTCMRFMIYSLFGIHLISYSIRSSICRHLISRVLLCSTLFSYCLFGRLLFSSFYIRSIDLLTLNREQVRAELLDVFISNGVEGSRLIFAVQTTQLVRIHGIFELGLFTRLVISTKSSQELVIAKIDVSILVLKERLQKVPR
ncbi:unnamed protein product [Prunus armeniaca]